MLSPLGTQKYVFEIWNLCIFIIVNKFPKYKLRNLGDSLLSELNLMSYISAQIIVGIRSMIL